MSSYKSPQCYDCKHKRPGLTCKAFERIPDDILHGLHDHRKPYPGDNGVLFEQEPDEEK